MTKTKNMIVKIWVVLLGLSVLNLMFFSFFSLLIAHRLLVGEKPINRSIVLAWQGMGWLLGPTRVGGLVKSLPEIIGRDTPKYYLVLFTLYL